MFRPELYQLPFTAVRNLPYCFDSTQMKEHGGGVIRRGHVVWLQNSPTAKGNWLVTAFVEGTGMVCVDPRFLAPASTTLGPEDTMRAAVRR